MERKIKMFLLTDYLVFFILILFLYNSTNLYFVLAITLIFITKDLLSIRLQQLKERKQITSFLMEVIEVKDSNTATHCNRVADYTKILCQNIKSSLIKKDELVEMAKIHDIGKIYVDDSILKKAGNLEGYQFEEMKKHSSYSFKILKNMESYRKNINSILYHHERYDGKGYPAGKKGEEIPVGARILSICDAFDVMVSGRSYKPYMTKEEIVEELKECAGKQFDPELAKLMIKLIDQGKFDDNFKREKREDKALQLSLNFN